MLRRTSGSDGLDLWARPAAVRYVGLALLLGASLLILGGAYRSQSNMVNTGLLWLALGVVFAPDAIRKWRMGRLALVALAIVGAAYALIT